MRQLTTSVSLAEESLIRHTVLSLILRNPAVTLDNKFSRLSSKTFSIPMLRQKQEALLY